ncbi:MAG: recX [Dehalococcoidia bacterium]|nr:recX [Dehalococcoidia bacterium]
MMITDLGTITAIEPQVRRKSRLNVFIAGEYAFSLSKVVAVDAGIRTGLSLSSEDIQRIQDAELLHRAKETAYRFLGYRPRSTAEVTTRLNRGGFSDTLIEQVVADLTSRGFLDDSAFASYWVERRTAHNPKGSRLISAELKRKGVRQESIEEATRDTDDLDSAYRAGKKKALSLGQDEYQQFRQRLWGYLVARGFSFDVVRSTIARLWQEGHGSDDDLNGEPL